MSHDEVAREIYERFEHTFDDGDYPESFVQAEVAAILRKHTSAPPALNWQPGGAHGNQPELFAGDQYLVAVHVRNSRTEPPTWYWEFAVITITEDGVEIDGESWGWDWNCVDWFVPVKHIEATLPSADEITQAGLQAAAVESREAIQRAAKGTAFETSAQALWREAAPPADVMEVCQRAAKQIDNKTISHIGAEGIAAILAEHFGPLVEQLRRENERLRDLAERSVVALHMHFHGSMNGPLFDDCRKDLCKDWHALQPPTTDPRP